MPKERDRSDDRTIVPLDIAYLDPQFSIFRSHINNVTADKACVTREFSMFRTDRSIVSLAFSIFRSHINNVIDRIAYVNHEFSMFRSHINSVDDRILIVRGE